jgi:hypothetical protein
MIEWKLNAKGDRISYLYAGRRMSVPNTGDPAEVLRDLLHDARTFEACSSFEAWALVLGLDPDSRTNERAHLRSGKIAMRLRRLLGPDYDAIAHEVLTSSLHHAS